MKGKGNWADIVDERLRTTHKSFIAYKSFISLLFIFTVESNEPKSGNTGFAFVIPGLKINITERTPDHLTVFTVELLAILNAVQWVEHNKMVVMCSESLSALVSLQSLSSHNRPDIVYEIYETLYRLNHIEI